jgi:hypothetical protein
MGRPARTSTRLRVESLERREVPATMTEGFNSPGGLPAGWSQWSSAGPPAFAVSSTRTLSPGGSLVSTAASNATARAWTDAPTAADSAVSVAVYADSLIPTELFARGANLASGSPSYYGVSVTRGATVRLTRVVDGVATALGTVTTAGYTSGVWLIVTLRTVGNQISAEVRHSGNGQYLNADGRWQAGATTALSVTDATISAAGRTGVNRPASYAGSAFVDDFAIASAGTGSATPPATGPTTPPTPDTTAAHTVFTDSFNSPGAVPAGWSQWSSSGTPIYSVSTTRTFSAGGALVSSAPSNVTGRVWAGAENLADATVSGVVFTDSLVPTELFARGANLASTSPTYYAASVTRGATLRLTRVVNGQPTVIGSVTTAAYTSGVWLKITLRVAGNQVSAEVQHTGTGQYLNSAGRWQAGATTAVSTTDTAITTAGRVGVNRPAAFAGAVYLDDFRVETAGGTAAPPTATPPPGNPPPVVTPPPANVNLPAIPRHYPHIRIASLAYAGTPMTAFEQTLLRDSVDVVIANPALMAQIDAIAPNTPQLIYTNVSNVYEDLLIDWLNYADANGQNRELAFYHVTQATPFSGGSPSSIPVNYLWRVARGSVDMTGASRTGTTGDMNFGSTVGTTTVFGYPERFGELNFNITTPRGSGWSAVWEYVSAVDANGTPTAWAALPIVADGTAGLNRSGAVRFDPPANWRASVASGSQRLFFVRLRVTGAGSSPVAATVLGRDYVGANGTINGVIPAFDAAADANGDGYLSDAEYAGRAAGRNARFVYESRLFYPAYGQMRFAVNPSPQAVRAWAVDSHLRLLAANPQADGFFVDNANGRAPLNGVSVAESTANYAVDSGILLGAINAAIGPKWVMPNTTGGNAQTNEIIIRTPSSMEEFALRPLATHWSRFGDIADLVRSRLTAPNAPFLVLDSHPQNGSPTDPRTQMATLAYYYLLADAEKTFLMFYGGFEPNTSWTRHWVPAAAFNIGAAQGAWSEFARGADPANTALEYRVYGRTYSNGLVLYKPTSYKLGVGTGTLADNTATTHQLGRAYRVLNADGSLGATVTSVTLRNGEGAVLVPA